ncbi:MAG: hypothetical protein IPP40_06490 [bacterium]|nr:hypothetical protein [bacterium]
MEISVADQGPGIPKDECRACLIAFIAEKMRFHLLEPVSGWPLREIVEAHGGTIRVQSEAGKGSVFSFTLRIAS